MFWQQTALLAAAAARSYLSSCSQQQREIAIHKKVFAFVFKGANRKSFHSVFKLCLRVRARKLRAVTYLLLFFFSSRKCSSSYGKGLGPEEKKKRYCDGEFVDVETVWKPRRRYLVVVYCCLIQISTLITKFVTFKTWTLLTRHQLKTRNGMLKRKKCRRRHPPPYNIYFFLWP